MTMMNDSWIAQSAIGIAASAYYLPKRLALSEFFPYTDIPTQRRTLYTETHGINFVHVAEFETALDMAEMAVRAMFLNYDLAPNSIDAMIVFHTMYYLSLEPSSFVAKLKQRLQLTNCHAFSISGQHCASSLSALRAARNMIVAGCAKKVVVIGCDWFLGSMNREIPNVSIQGEGAVCLLVEAQAAGEHILSVRTHVDGSLYKGIAATAEDFAHFDRTYYLAAYRLITRTLKHLQLTIQDISLIIPHNVNRSSWRTLMRHLQCDESMLFHDNIGKCGHICSSDLFINLTDAREQHKLRKGEYCMLFTVGLGAVWACCILRI